MNIEHGQNKERDFEQVFKERYHALYFYALNILKDEEEAKDVVSDTFEWLWNNWAHTDRSRLSAFLYSCVRNRCIDKTRHFTVSENYKRQVLDSALTYEQDGEDLMEERLKQVDATIRHMPEQTRRVFTMCFLDNMSYKEAGAALGISVNTVKTHVSKALKMLRGNSGAMLLAVLSLIASMGMTAVAVCHVLSLYMPEHIL